MIYFGNYLASFSHDAAVTALWLPYAIYFGLALFIASRKYPRIARAVAVSGSAIWTTFILFIFFVFV
jgi:hypothetical protein